MGSGGVESAVCREGLECGELGVGSGCREGCVERGVESVERESAKCREGFEVWRGCVERV